MRKLIVILLITVVGFGCSKYDENPALSALPKKVRITGTWMVKLNVDKDEKEHEVSEELSELTALELKWNGGGKQGESDITWYFSKDKKFLVTTYNNDPSVFYKQNILKLTNTELWLGTTEDGYAKYEKK